MDMTVWMFLGGQLITGAAIWGAIRADIRNMQVRMNDVKQEADEAHSRIDRILERDDTYRKRER